MLGQGTVPGVHWDSIAQNAPWSRDSLRAIGEYVRSTGSGAVMVVDDGRVVAAWGEPARRFPLASVRKSLLHALLGTELARGTLSTSATLAQLGIDDEPPLTSAERSAHLSDLLASRSGIYHASAFEPSSMRSNRPARGSAAPGERWFYNNWDFNALGTIFEHASGRKIFDAFGERIARPLEMEDYSASDGEYQLEPVSRHAAYLFRMSARDLARFGVLYMRRGAWGSAQLLPQEWVAAGVQAQSDAGTAGAYGQLWWVARDGMLVPGVLVDSGAFAARGAGPHYLIVIPTRRLVIVHLTDTDTPSPEKYVSRDAVGTMVKRILAARRPG